MNREAPACRHCASTSLETFVDLGKMPLANSFLQADELDRPQPSYPLHARVCRSCLLVQVPEVVPPQDIFHEYAYFSSFADTWTRHAHEFVDRMESELRLSTESQVVEIASNDGYLLRHVVERGIPAFGIEPAGNVAEAAIARGVPTIIDFFDGRLAADLVDSGIRADLLVANNVLAHVPDINDFISGLAKVLSEDGLLTVEFPHFLRLLEDVQFDTIYHEHFSYLSLMVVERMFSKHGLRVRDVEELPTHGGSLRVHAVHAHRADGTGPGLVSVRQDEHRAGIGVLDTYRGFQTEVERCRRSLLEFMDRCSSDRSTVVGYGAAAKGNTLINYCGLDRRDISVVADRNPHKQGRFLPGSHIPVVPPGRLEEISPGWVLILPWNLKDEIMSQLEHLRDQGARFLTAVPQVEVIT